MMFLVSLLLLSGWIVVVFSITLMGVDFMDSVIIRNAWFCTLYLMCRLLMTMLLIRTPDVVVLFRYMHSSTLLLLLFRFQFYM